MSAQSASPATSLPRSHYFLTISRGEGMRTFALRSHVVHVLALIVPLVGLGGIGAMLYLAFHDDLVASLMARQSERQYAYEDRIDALRGELERQTRRQVSDQAAVESRMHDLILRESRLESRAAVVAGLTTRTGAVRGSAAGMSLAAESVAAPRVSAALDPPFGAKPASAAPPELMGYVPTSTATVRPYAAAKPHPETDPVEPDSEAVRAPGPVSALDRHFAMPTRLSLISASLDQIEHAQLGALSRIDSQARDEAAHLRGVLQEAGLSLDRFDSSSAAGVGGPFVPLEDEKDTPFGNALSDLRETLASATHLRSVVTRVPLVGPLPGTPEVTSPFGARIDPFLGRPALHPGVDLKEGYGADVKSTAAGRVAFAGLAGG